MYITICKIDSGSLLCATGHSTQCYVTARGVGGRWEAVSRGRGPICAYIHTYIHTYIHAYIWLIHVDIWLKPTRYCKAIISQLKKFLKKFLFTCLKEKKTLWFFPQLSSTAFIVKYFFFNFHSVFLLSTP